MRFLFAFTCLLAVAAASKTFNVKNCDKSLPGSIKTVTFDQYPVPKGKPVQTTIAGNDGITFSSGTVKSTTYKYALAWIKVSSENRNACEDFSCPLSGDFSGGRAIEVPSLAPSGSYKVKFELDDDSGKKHACGEVEFEVGSSNELLDSQANNIACTMCTTFVGEVDKVLTDDKTQSEVETVLENLCERVPFVAAQCKAVVGDFSSEIMNMLAQEADPNTICNAIGLCK